MVDSQGMIRTILGLCARDRGHDLMYELLRKNLESYRIYQYSWEELVHQAEFQGIAPLLYKHSSALDFTLPDGQHRILRSLYQRNRLANRIRNRVIASILELFDRQHLDTLLIKGIALSNVIYESPGLRPMRDIDLLVGKQDLKRTCALLEDQGFVQARHHDIPDGYYHLPPLHKSVDGLPINIEIHHELLPPDASYPVWLYGHINHKTYAFPIDGVETSTLTIEDSLHYLYLHGFKAPLTYEPYRLIHVADIVSLTEMFFDRIDWDRIQADFPSCLNILSRFHFITPWQKRVSAGLKLNTSSPPRNPGAPYRGWPLVKIKDTPVTAYPRLIKETLLPPQWWQQVYYGQIDGAAYYATRWHEHPRTIWRWIKTYVAARYKKS